MGVYHAADFNARVTLAAQTIARGGETSRKFDTCFEMHDGDAVVAALVRRARSNPVLAKNLPRYISADSLAAAPQNLADHENLTGWARELRLKAQEDHLKWLAKMDAEATAQWRL